MYIYIDVWATQLKDFYAFSYLHRHKKEFM